MTITKSIGLTGRDYASLQAAWDALPSTLADNYVFELYNDGELTSTLMADGKTQGAYSITFRSAAGHGFRDNANKLTNALRYNPANGVAISASVWQDAPIHAGSGITLVFDGLQVKNSHTDGYGVWSEGTNSSVIKNCLVEASASSGTYPVVSATTVQNCILIQSGSSGQGVAGLATVKGCTIIAPAGSTGAGLFAEWDSRTVSDNAVFGFATPFGVLNGGTYSAGSDYNATDAATTPNLSSAHNLKSLVAASQFVSAAAGSLDLRVKTGASIIGAGLYDAAIDPDILGTARSATTPTIGAMEYASAAPDTTAPTLTSATGTATAPTTASGSVTTDEANGTLKAVVTTSATKPSVAQIKAGQDNTGAAAAYAASVTVTATGAQAFSATGLTASTTYYWHFQQVDAAANDSTVVSSASFTTPAANAAPTFSGTVADITGTQGTALTNVDVASKFSDTDALTYSKVGTWPAGVTLTGSVIGGTPTVSGTFASLKVRATDTASQTVDSNAFSMTLAASSDTTVPTLTGSITSSAITTSGFTITWPAGADNVAVAGYEYSTDAGTTWLDAGNVLTKAVTGLAASTAYSVKVRAYDASGNKSTPALAATVTTATPASGTVTTPDPLKNNATTVQASLTGLVVQVLLGSTGAAVVNLTGKATDASGFLAVTDAAITPGTDYFMAFVDLTTGDAGITNKVTAT